MAMPAAESNAFFAVRLVGAHVLAPAVARERLLPGQVLALAIARPIARHDGLVARLVQLRLARPVRHAPSGLPPGLAVLARLGCRGIAAMPIKVKTVIAHPQDEHKCYKSNKYHE